MSDPGFGGRAGGSSGVPARVNDDFATKRAQDILTAQLAEGLRAIDDIKELRSLLDRRDASLALADDRCMRLSQQLEAATAKGEAWMRVAASACASIEHIGSNVQAAAALARESGSIVDKAINMLRPEADKLHQAAQLLDSLTGIIESAAADAKNAAFKPTFEWPKNEADEQTLETATVVGNLRGGDATG